MSTNYLTSVTSDEVMGTVVSVHVVFNAEAATTEAATTEAVTPEAISHATKPGHDAVQAFLAGMQHDEAVFSPFLETSAIRQLAVGNLTLADAPPEVREVEAACREALEITQGRFDAWHRGWFDPTGYVKGWSVERNFVQHLAPLLNTPGIVAVGANCGGDLRVATMPGVGWTWKTGIVNPFDNQQVIAKFELTNGAVATSGPAERGAHIVNPVAHSPAQGVASATVIADTLDKADLWATTAVVAGFDDLTWLVPANTNSGLIVASDIADNGNLKTRRWSGIAELVET